MGKRFKTAIISKPKGGKNGKLLDPADREAMNRYQSVTRKMRKGMPEAEAIARYDQPRGLCSKLIAGALCGKPATRPGGRVCADCNRARAAKLGRKQRAAYAHYEDKRCTKCRKKFNGHRLRSLCYVCHPEVKDKRIRVTPPQKKKRPSKTELPPTWDRPLPAHKLAPPPPKPEPVRSPAGAKYTRCASTVPDRWT